MHRSDNPGGRGIREIVTLPPADEHGQKKPALQWFCLNLSDYSPFVQQILLFMGILGFFVLNSWIEEYLVAVLPDFQYALYMTFFELLCFSILCPVERYIMGEAPLSHNASINRHLMVAVAMTLSRGLTNVSLQYLNYPTQVIFKSMKLITVMMGSIILLRKSFPVTDYVSAVLLVGSAILFSLGDADVSPRYTTVGLVIVVVSLFFDSLHANFQDSLMHSHKATELEVLLYPNAMSALLILLAVLAKGEFVPAYEYCQIYPIAYVLFILRGIALYLGARTFITTINGFGAYTATTMTTVRKVVTVLLSFLLISKPFTSKYVWGLLLFAAGLFFGMKKKPSSNPAQVKVELTTPKKNINNPDNNENQVPV